MKIICPVHGVCTPHDGRYVVLYDPLPKDGGGPILETTLDIDKAIKFKDAVDALELWKRGTGKIRPLDGKPDRPLTMYTIEVLKVPL